MFRLVDEKTHRWFPVEVETFNDEGRKLKTTFDGQFEVITQDEVDELVRNLDNRTPAEVVRPYFAGFRKVEDAEGNAVPSTPENASRLLNVAGVARAVWRAFLRAHGIESKN